MAVAAGALALVPSQAARAATITNPPGPLTSIDVSSTLNCSASYLGDTYPEWYSTTACGTFVSLNGRLFGPASVPAGSAGQTPYTPVSQSGVTGTGTAADPFTVVTTVRAGDLALITQTDRYVVGQEFYTTDVTVDNTSGGTLTGNIYTGGDCYLQNSDWGYGEILGTSPVCAATPEPGGRLMALLPRTGGSSYYEAWYYDIWDAIRTQTPLPDSCLCDQFIDNGIALSWPLRIPAGASDSWSWTTDFSPEGHVPLTVSASAQSPASPAGSFNGYRITIANGNPESALVDTVTVTLPPGFTYLSGTTTGVTTADPAISGQTLTWTGPFDISPGGEITVDFDVRVAPDPGTYTIDATATADHNVTPATGAAAITVGAVADLSLTKTASPALVTRGSPVIYTLTAHNAGPSTAPAVVITDTLPPGFTFSAASPACFHVGQTVTCDIGSMADGASATATITVTTGGSTPVGYSDNSAAVSGGVLDMDPLNNEATAPVLVTPFVLAMSKTAQPAFAGDDLTWAMNVSNGTAIATPVTVTDTLPAGLTFVSAAPSPPGAGSCSFDPGSRTVTCSLTGVAAGATVPITLVTGTPPDLVPPGSPSVTETNTATAVSALTRATVSATAQAQVFAAARVVPSKTVSPSPVIAGGLATYEVSVTNDGPSRATSATAADVLPEGLTFDAAASDARCALVVPTTSTVRCVDPGALAPGEKVTFKVVARVDADLGNGSDIVNDESASAAQLNPDPAEDARAASTIVRQVDLTVTKVPSQNPVRAGEPFFYTITVVNHGPSAASDVVIADQPRTRALRGGLQPGGMGEADCLVTGVSFQCMIPDLLPGDSITFDVPVTTPADTPNGTVLRNVVVISSSSQIIDPSDTTAEAVVTVESGVPVTG